MNNQFVYVVRHGETALNADGRLRGLANPGLNDVGIRQAAALASVFASLAVAVIVHSPLRRAVETASIIARCNHGEHHADDRFNDRDYGQWTGQLKTDVVAQWGAIDEAPGVEPVASVVARARPALDEWSERARNVSRTLMIVTHDAVIKALLTELDPSVELLDVPTGSYQLIRRHRGRWHIEETGQVP